MSHWIRFEHKNKISFGALRDGQITVHTGNLFDQPQPTSELIPLENVKLLTPTEPTKMVGLVNNLRAAAIKQNLSIPEEPLFFIKPTSCFLPTNTNIPKPTSYNGRVMYEGELGIVFGKTCKNISETEVEDCIFGYTCVNDVTAFQLIDSNESFAQWSRAKSFDGFGSFGPTIATNIDPQTLQIQTLLNGRVRQDYPVSDMIFPPNKLVQLISRDMTFYPGDVICCGTSLGVLPMRPGTTVEIKIDGIGTLHNTYGKEKISD
jgi:2-keto-4-pentenoate hydratase/2-oxohepta-3-ene-1,7-dioic acid hydratase in catechol pathway